MAKRVTLEDIAAATGLSTSTVSRVLSGSILISDEKTALILKTADDLGYLRRIIKRHGGRAIMNVLLFLPMRRDTYSHLFYDAADLITGIRSGFGKTRVNIVIRLDDDQVLHEHKKSGDIDGCIFAFCEPSELMSEQLLETGVRTVLINRTAQGMSSIVSDAAKGMGILAEKIREKRGAGVTVRFLGFNLIPTVSKDRRDGLLKACNKMGLNFDNDGSREIDNIHEIDATFVSEITGGATPFAASTM